MLKNHGGNSAMSKASTWMVEFPLPRLKPEARTGDHILKCSSRLAKQGILSSDHAGSLVVSMQVLLKRLLRVGTNEHCRECLLVI